MHHSYIGSRFVTFVVICRLVKKMETKNSGFTFVEILIAILAVGILATVIAFSLNIIKKNSADSRRLGDVQQIAKALELYYDKHAEYPGALSGLVAEKLLPAVPVPPLGKGQVFYSYIPLGENQICTGYHLGASMESIGSEFFARDADAYPGTPCALATSPDFDGTALNCQAGVQGEGVKGDNCYDIKI